LTDQRYTLRLVEPSDEPFLLELFATTQGQQFYLLPLEPPQRDALVRMQFEAQRTSYRQQYPASEHFVILIDQQPAGRLWVDESGEEVRVIDIVLAPGYQGRGLGKQLLQQVIANADTTGRAVRLFVDRMNARAFELYRRFGFEVCGEYTFYLEMRREPEPEGSGGFEKERAAH
jgi:ribosomal protein S18 acetylase RimI-like enzyme